MLLAEAAIARPRASACKVSDCGEFDSNAAAVTAAM